MAGVHALLLGAASAFVFQQTISANTTNYNLRNAAIAAGWNQQQPLFARITINSGVYVSSSSIATHAFDRSGSFPAGSMLELVNNGFIVGRGGNGGAGRSLNFAVGGFSAGGSAGGAGGPALSSGLSASITNNGTIAGGGGGGGGGGGAWSETGDSKNGYQFNGYGGGGGGGGRSSAAGNSSAGGGGTVVSFNANSPGSTGGAGTVSAAGGGGAGGSNVGGTGGSGGGWGSSGANGSAGTLVSAGNTNNLAGFSGASAGAAVNGNSNVTWVATGTRLGAINA